MQLIAKYEKPGDKSEFPESNTGLDPVVFGKKISCMSGES